MSTIGESSTKEVTACYLKESESDPWEAWRLSLEGIGAFGGLGTTFGEAKIAIAGGSLGVYILGPAGAFISGISIGLFLNKVYFFSALKPAVDIEALRIQAEAAKDLQALGLPLSSHSKKLLESWNEILEARANASRYPHNFKRPLSRSHGDLWSR